MTNFKKTIKFYFIKLAADFYSQLSYLRASLETLSYSVTTKKSFFFRLSLMRPSNSSSTTERGLKFTKLLTNFLRSLFILFGWLITNAKKTLKLPYCSRAILVLRMTVRKEQEVCRISPQFFCDIKECWNKETVTSRMFNQKRKLKDHVR